MRDRGVTPGMTMLSRLRRLVAAFLLSIAITACSESVDLVGSLSESEANEILATLLQAGIEAEKVPAGDGLITVQVASDKVAQALQIMRANGLPREQFTRMGDVFKKEGLISSPLEERARYIYALSQELAETISQIDGVIVARVHVVLPDRTPGTAEIVAPSSAAVFIKYKEAYNLDSVVPQIKRLVTNSISDLSYDNVSVILVPSMVTTTTARSVLPDTTRILGVEMLSQSRPAFVAIVAVLIVIAVAGLAGTATLYWLWRVKPKQNQKADAET